MPAHGLSSCDKDYARELSESPSPLGFSVSASQLRLHVNKTNFPWPTKRAKRGQRINLVIDRIARMERAIVEIGTRVGLRQGDIKLLDEIREQIATPTLPMIA